MQIVENLNLASALDTCVSLAAAFVLGGIIGLERQYRQRTAGLRTNVLVAPGSGVIMREEGNVRGLNTAATLWGSAAVGACAGADLIVEAILATVFVLAANTLLRPVVNRINRQPMDTNAVEVTNTVYVIAPRTRQTADYPTRGLVVHAFGEDAVEIEAVLAATAIEGAQMDAVIQELSSLDCISQAFWSPSTTE